MTPRPSTGPADPLAVLTSTLLARARREAEACLAGADAQADALVSEARAQADAMLADAGARGAADGAAVVAAERARAEREARSVLLCAQRVAHDEARQAAREAVSALRSDAAYPSLIEALRDRVIRDLGPDATVTEHDRGGILAEVSGRRVAYSLDDLADDLMDRLGSDLEELWLP